MPVGFHQTWMDVIRQPMQAGEIDVPCTSRPKWRLFGDEYNRVQVFFILWNG
ncbi:MAG TPA: hypothetical protein VN363_05735 [Anaerolineales bacterium]|nr:hypothetical protein [Anaerolineales bacterium]